MLFARAPRPEPSSGRWSVNGVVSGSGLRSSRRRAACFEAILLWQSQAQIRLAKRHPAPMACVGRHFAPAGETFCLTAGSINVYVLKARPQAGHWERYGP